MKDLKQIIKVSLLIVVFIIVAYTIICSLQKIIWKDKIPSFFGFKMFVVLSGSMEPRISVGDIIITRKVDEVKKGDIISFKIKDTVITHRVQQVIEGDNGVVYTTKGDANSATDLDLVKKENIEGRYLFKIPYIGNFILVLQTWMAKVVLVLILGVVLFIYNYKKRISRALGRNGKH